MYSESADKQEEARFLRTLYTCDDSELQNTLLSADDYRIVTLVDLTKDFLSKRITSRLSDRIALKPYADLLRRVRDGESLELSMSTVRNGYTRQVVQALLKPILNEIENFLPDDYDSDESRASNDEDAKSVSNTSVNQFGSGANTSMHRRHSELQFHCDVCKKSYASADSLRYHKRKYHA
jgi:hypothetical protein